MAVASLSVQTRQRLGKAFRAGRRDGLVAANIVSKGQPSRAIEVAEKQLTRVLQQVGYTQPVELEVDQKDRLTALVTDVQFKPTRRICQHVVFQEVHRGEKMTVNVPVVLEGESPGVLSGWLLLQTTYSLEVTAGALSLPEQISVDVSQLTVDDPVIRVDSLKLPDGVETAVEPETPVVRLEKSRAAVSQEDEAERAEGDEAEAGDGDESGSGAEAPEAEGEAAAGNSEAK